MSFLFCQKDLVNSYGNFINNLKNMVIKVRKKNEKDKFYYRSSKGLILPHEAKKADKFDKSLNEIFRKMESFVIKNNLLSRVGNKDNTLKFWYYIGRTIRDFLKKNNISKEDENIFWRNLYEKSELIHGGKLLSKVSLTRNDFKIAVKLSEYNFNTIKMVGPWSLWREMLSYKKIQEDQRLLDYVIMSFSNKQITRDNARFILKSIIDRFKRIDTNILTQEELQKKINEI